MPTKRFGPLLAVLFLGFALTPTAVMGQGANAGSVAGLITDTSGGAVGGASIALTDKATGIPRTTASNEAGRYLFANVPPGLYEITANKTGFRVAKVSQIEVTIRPRWPLSSRRSHPTDIRPAWSTIRIRICLMAAISPTTWRGPITFTRRALPILIL